MTNIQLQSVRMGRMEIPEKKSRPFAVWYGSRKIAENMTRGEALAMIAGYCMGEEKRKPGPLVNGGNMRHALWRFSF